MNDKHETPQDDTRVPDSNNSLSLYSSICLNHYSIMHGQHYPWLIFLEQFLHHLNGQAIIGRNLHINPVLMPPIGPFSLNRKLGFRKPVQEKLLD